MNKLVAQRISLRWLTARQRLEQFLWELLSVQVPVTRSTQPRLQVPLKHVEIAQLINITRQHLARLWNELEQEGILRRDKGWFVIPEPAKLWHWTDSLGI